MLFRLVGRYAARGRGGYDFETFRKAAIFRGLADKGAAEAREAEKEQEAEIERGLRLARYTQLMGL